MKVLKRFYLLSVVVFIGMGSGAYAQSGHFSASSLGMGGTGTAFQDSYHANFVNPANLMLNSETKPSVSFGLLGGLSATAGGPLVNISVYNDYFTKGATVNAKNVLNEWFGTDPSSSNRLALEFDIIPFGFSWRGQNMSLSLALRNRSLFQGAMNRGYAEILLAGISQERFEEPKPVNFGGKAVIFSEVSAGLSFKIVELSALKVYAGVAPKYIIPNYTSGLDFNSTLQVTDRKIIHDFRYTFQTVGQLATQFREYYEENQQEDFDGSLADFVEPDGKDFTEVQGSGFGLDLGGTIEIDLKGDKSLRFGIAVTDFGTISYENEAGIFTANDTFTWDGIDFDESFEKTLSDSISKEIYLNYEPGNQEKIEEELPTQLSLGGHFQLGKLALTVDIKKGLNEVGMNSRRLVTGFGAEYKLFNFLPFRVGYRTGGLTSPSITFGTGIELRNFELTVAGLTVPDSREHGSAIGGAWSGLLFRF